MKNQQWEFNPIYNYVTAIKPGNHRVMIADKIYGVNERARKVNGRLIALAPRMSRFVHMVLETATIETNKEVLVEAEDIIKELILAKTILD